MERKLGFWRTFGLAQPVAMQFWSLYSICNEKTKSTADIWVEGELRLSFRRTFSEEMLLNWEELRAVVEQVNITDGSDALI
jgi:hypothetical protein